MITANFSAYDSYVTDSVYQWDLNRVLRVTGLNIATAPEIHFSNATMDRAIVRRATLTDHVVTVNIPNSLLQYPLPIEADIGIYEGDTFKIIERVRIPVIAKTRPADYQIQDSDEEIYSFKALENKVDEVLNAWETLKQIFENYDDILETLQNKANKPTVVEATLSASGWNGDTYSFEDTYPEATHDIEIALNSTATADQAEAFNSAQIVGSATTNTVKAFGDVPSVDIPIILKVVTK